MRWTLAFLLAACGPADPDARLRAGDLPGAAEAHAAKHGGAQAAREAATVKRA